MEAKEKLINGNLKDAHTRMERERERPRDMDTITILPGNTTILTSQVYKVVIY